MKLKGNAEKFCYMIKSAIAFFACAFVLIANSANVEAAEFVIRNSPPDTSNKYYYDSNYNANAGGKYAMPNCTTYVLGRIYEITGKRCNLSGDAKEYFENNKASGTYAYSTDQYSPKKGAILCFTNSANGHVAIVEEIGEDSGGKYICVSESNYSGREAGKETKRFNYIKYYLSDLSGFTSEHSPYSIKKKHLEDNDGYSEEYEGTTYSYPLIFQGYIYCDDEENNEDIDNTRIMNSSKFTNLYIDQLTDTSVKIGTEYAWDSFADAGFYFGTVNDINQMTKVSETKHGATFPQSSDGNSYKLGVWYNDTYGYKWWEPLTPGMTYYWAFYLTQGNTEYISTINSFTTTGDSVRPVIDSINVTDLSSDGYTVEVVATDNVGVAKVCCPTWTTANEQDDLVNDWGNNAVATRAYDNTYTYRVNISDHNNESGIYTTHVYVYDMTGNTSMNLDLLVEVPEPSLPSTLNGLVQVDGSWGYYKNGVLQTSYTGLVQSSSTGTWYYVQNGKISWNYTGLVQSSSTGTWYYVENGRINWNYTGLVQSSSTGTWYYVQKGRISWNYTGLVQSSSTGTWYYVQKGRIAWNYTGLVQSDSTGTWYYVQKGRIAWNYTGIVKSGSTGNSYYVQKGRIAWTYTGLVKHTDGRLYYIKKGCVDWNYSLKEEDTIEVSWLHEMSALVGHNDKFWYTCSTTDNLGNGYKYQVFCGAESYSNEITYALDGKYKILSGTLGLRNADNDLEKGIWIEFYGDGKLIGETVRFVAGTRPYTFEIDVTGVTDLMIKTNSTSIYSSGYLLTDGFKVSE